VPFQNFGHLVVFPQPVKPTVIGSMDVRAEARTLQPEPSQSLNSKNSQEVEKVNATQK
jgi:hypothetical protein